MIKIFLFTLVSISFFGCGTKQTQQPIAIEQKISPKIMKAPISTIKEHHTEKFKLFIASPNATRIRILNIKPKYRDGILLKPGRYHIELSAKKHIIYKEWISLKKDTKLTITLRDKKSISKGFVYWKEIKGLKYINGVFWQDSPSNENHKIAWKEAVNYCKNLKISINKHIVIDDFTLPNEEELLELRQFNSHFDYTGDIYWSSVINKEHPQFAKYIYLKQEKRGWYNKSGKTYVRCISRRHYPLQFTLQKLTKYLMQQEKYSYLDAYSLALYLKYGKPIISNIVKINKQKVKFILHSQKYNSQKKYFYYKNITTKEKHKIKKDSEIKFEIINNKLIFRSVD